MGSFQGGRLQVKVNIKQSILFGSTEITGDLDRNFTGVLWAQVKLEFVCLFVCLLYEKEILNSSWRAILGKGFGSLIIYLFLPQEIVWHVVL